MVTFYCISVVLWVLLDDCQSITAVLWSVLALPGSLPLKSPTFKFLVEGFCPCTKDDVLRACKGDKLFGEESCGIEKGCRDYVSITLYCGPDQHPNCVHNSHGLGYESTRPGQRTTLVKSQYSNP